ncbi:unnamed protein product, partial [Mesorhabditis spiculigera]
MKGPSTATSTATTATSPKKSKKSTPKVVPVNLPDNPYTDVEAAQLIISTLPTQGVIVSTKEAEARTLARLESSGSLSNHSTADDHIQLTVAAVASGQIGGRDEDEGVDIREDELMDVSDCAWE